VEHSAVPESDQEHGGRVAGGLSALGLSAVEADVLAAVVESEEASFPTLCVLTGASHTAVSVAVGALVHRGLLERVMNRRPSLVLLSDQASFVLERLTRAAEAQRQRAEEDVREAVAAVGVAAERRRQRGRPYYELQPAPRGVSDAGWPRPRGQTSHDEVLPAVEAVRGLVGRARLRCFTRLIVVGAHADLEQIAGRQPPGSETRGTTVLLPQVWVLDGERVGVMASTPQGPRAVWSRDGAHLAAAQEQFERWWQACEPGVVTPQPVPRWSEAELDVEEEVDEEPGRASW
jgi:DNA-binding MarR family transcriptional regulator